MVSTVTRRGMLAAAALMAVALVGTGCSNNTGETQEVAQPTDAVVAPQMRVAVLPFENLTNFASAGTIAPQLITTELYRARLFSLMEETAVRRALFDNKVDMTRLAESSYAQEVGRTLGADAVVVGSVSEYGYQHGLREEPTVGFNARLVRSADGKVLWAASISEVGRGFFTRDSVNEVGQRVAARLVAGLSTLARTTGLQ